MTRGTVCHRRVISSGSSRSPRVVALRVLVAAPDDRQEARSAEMLGLEVHLLCGCLSSIISASGNNRERQLSRTSCTLNTSLAISGENSSTYLSTGPTLRVSTLSFMQCSLLIVQHHTTMPLIAL